ncbi:MAG: bifunctional diaminohydroxyphosphoribosylaminopyrimidine deaminase/5-amino-6-(5-phosphoribosylamino)uracil reductase RibD [Acidobacteria bacterium]|nr:bifunctional diaminohydroxyphosphoribosylaminopyrimidine deaminase/5-amino-6-(5-phosphoribosylamino)uracil reductase RibD [Acidobacteriota bacterium]
MSNHLTDDRFLHRALELARQGIGLASPNPCVGAVIVDKSGNVVGEGFHTYAGIKHAEVLAIEQAGKRADGATLYLNLEPCSHQGRTGPCAEAVIAAGIRRVVASLGDPNPQVSGRGFERLRAAGVAVEVGRLHEEAGHLNEAFAKYIRHRAPLVTLKSALTLDGKLAPAGKQGQVWITGAAARAHVHELRHQHDAIAVGIGTVLADDPLLTDRSARPRRRPLLRVLFDSRLRLPLDSRLAQSAQQDVLVFHGAAEEARKDALQKRGIRLEQAPLLSPGRLDLAAIARRLGELEITSLLIEGGSTVNGAILTTHLADKIFLYYAPKMLGDHAVPFAAGLTNATSVNSPRLHRFGEDFAVEGYLRDPYAG